MSEDNEPFKLGDTVWYVPRGYLIAIKCTITAIDGEFRKKDPNAYLFYWVDEPTGHALADDEFWELKEDAISEMIENSETSERHYDKPDTLQDVRNRKIHFIMSTWPEDKRNWTEVYPDKQEGVDWLNITHIKGMTNV